MTSVPTAVSNNPVTTTAAVGLLVQSLLAIWGASAEVQAQAARITLAAAVLLRALVAWWQSRKPKPSSSNGKETP